MVLSGSGIFSEYREVTGTPPGSIWALLGLSGIEEREGKRGRRAPHQAQSELGGGSASLSFLPLSSFLPLLLLLGRGESYSRREYDSHRARHREGRATPLYTGEGASLGHTS